MRAVICFAVLVIACAVSTVKSDDTAMAAPDALSAASNRFAVDLYAQVRQATGNICISPFSVSSALEMTTAGAAGNTARQMLTVLHWDQPVDTLPAAAAALNQQIVCTVDSATTQPLQTGDGTLISIANALFGQAGYSYHQPFLDLLARQYAAPLQSVDFAAQPQQAAEQINKWAAEKTHDRIQNAVSTSVITPATRLVLVDAIYFKSAWQDAFSKGATQQQPFYMTGDQTMTRPLMQQKHMFGYMENDALQAVELPYQSDFSMVILLPKQRDGLAGVERSLTADSLADWMKQLALVTVQVTLPKFKIEGEYELSSTLGKLGMTDAFDAQKADFSGISSSDKLCIDRVIHKTYIEVDETGTEAAAVTAITMRMTAIFAGHRVEPKIFRADHPFLYVLKNRSTGAILFMGRLTAQK